MGTDGKNDLDDAARHERQRQMEQRSGLVEAKDPPDIVEDKSGMFEPQAKSPADAATAVAEP